MRKSDKKIEKQLRDGLTNVCDHLLDQALGFEWITHTVNFNRFPNSLRIICIFNSKNAEESFRHSPHCSDLLAVINHKLQQQGLPITLSATQLHFDNEESCQLHHQGNWSARLSSH